VTTGGGRDLSFRAISRSALILMGGAAGVQVLGVVRELFVAAEVGISQQYDALLIALVLPTTLAGVLASGTATAMVPAYLEARDNRSREDAQRLAGVISVWVGIGGLSVWLALEIFAPVAIAIGGPGLSLAARAMAIAYLQVLAPLAFVSALSGILYGLCQAEERFAAIAWSGLAASATTLATLLVLWPWLQLGALAVGSLVGPIVGLAVLLAATMRASIAPRPALWTSRDEMAAFARHTAPLTLSGAILQINVFGDRAIASLLAPGAVSALRYGDVLVRTPISAISPAWGAALYPALVRSALDIGAGLGSATERSIRLVLALFIPVATFTAAVAPVAVAVVYARGAFGALDVAQTAPVVAAFAPLIVVLMCAPSLSGALNARRRGDVLLAAGVLNVILNISLDVVLGIPLGAAGVALSSSITGIAVLVFFGWRLSRSERAFTFAPIWRTLRLATIATLPVAIPIAALVWSGLVPSGTLVGLVALLVFGVVGMLGYAIVALALGLDEAREIRQLGIEWNARRRRKPGASR
jgi:putative peptidoglycan lipid II flippase